MNYLFNFQNHTSSKLLVQHPVVFNVELILIVVLPLIFLNKREKNDNLLNISFTNEVRGFAILMIIIHHLCRHILNNSYQYPLFYDLGYIGVALFLFLSGYGLMESYKLKGLKNYFSKKVTRIYIPFVFINIICLLLGLLNGTSKGILSNIKYSTGLLLIIDEYWFIPYLFFWYIIFYVIIKLNIKEKYKALIFIIIGMMILVGSAFGNGRYNAFSFPLGVIASFYIKDIEKYYNKYINRGAIFNTLIVMLFISTTLVLYAIGHLFPTLEVSLIFMIMFYLAILFIYKTNIINKVSFTILFVVSTFYLYKGDIIINFIYNITGIIAMITIIIFLAFVSKNKRCIIYDYLGKISMELYLIHFILMNLYDFILFKSPIYISFLVYLFFIVIVASILNMFFNKISNSVTKLLKL